MSWLPPAQRHDQWRDSAELPQVPEVEHPLRLLGRGTRQWADESRPAISHALARLLIAAPVVDHAIAGDSAIVQAARAAPNPESAVATLFLAILGRMPHIDEQADALRHLANYPQTALSDLSWALVNTTEFLFQH